MPGDATQTAQAIADNEVLWRWGLAVHLLYLVPAIVVNVLVAGLFRTIAPTLARLALVFGVAGVTVEAVSLLYLYLPLALLEERGALVAVSADQRDALALSRDPGIPVVALATTGIPRPTCGQLQP